MFVGEALIAKLVKIISNRQTVEIGIRLSNQRSKDSRYITSNLCLLIVKLVKAISRNNIFPEIGDVNSNLARNTSFIYYPHCVLNSC